MHPSFSLIFYYAEFLEGGITVRATVRSMKVVLQGLNLGNLCVFVEWMLGLQF